MFNVLFFKKILEDKSTNGGWVFERIFPASAPEANVHFLLVTAFDKRAFFITDITQKRVFLSRTLHLAAVCNIMCESQLFLSKKYK